MQEDQAAIRRLKNGDIRGLEDLITHYQTKAIRAAYLITQDRAMAEDIVMDTYLDIYAHIASFEEGKPFEPYFLRCVVNKTLNTIRINKREMSFDSEDAMRRLMDLLAQAVPVETQIEAADLESQILNAIAELPARQRMAVVMRFYLEMSEAEMAAALNAPRGTVKWLLHKARVQLQSLLDPQRSER